MTIDSLISMKKFLIEMQIKQNNNTLHFCLSKSKCPINTCIMIMTLFLNKNSDEKLFWDSGTCFYNSFSSLSN